MEDIDIFGVNQEHSESLFISVSETGYHVTQADLKLSVVKDNLQLLIFLPPFLLLEYQDYRCGPPFSVYAMLGLKLANASCMLGKHSIS